MSKPRFQGVPMLVRDLLFLVTLSGCGGPDGDPIGLDEIPPRAEDPWDDTYPAWSPNGSEIAIASDRHDSLSHRSDIYLLDTLGNAVRLTNGLDAKSPTWSPDGLRIAFSSGGGSRSSIVMVRG